MKKLLFISLLLSLNILACELPAPKIVSYDLSHKDAVLKIAFEDVFKFFCGSAAVTLGFMAEEQFIEANKAEMDKILTNPHSTIEVLLAEDKVAGFVEFNKTREQSIESMIKMMADQGLPAVTPEQLAFALPQLKKTDEECKDYALIECLAVTKDFRGKGYGKALLKYAIEKIKQKWPTLDQVRLTVNESNAVACKLYESVGFTRNPNQLAMLTMMEIAEYQKSLK
ncbi:hypothetical protein BH09DEP1_BH09DEP1_2750 [soil metagenome]